MMNQKKSSASSSWKYLSLLPILVLSVLCLNDVKSNSISGSIDDPEKNVMTDAETLTDTLPPKINHYPTEGAHVEKHEHHHEHAHASDHSCCEEGAHDSGPGHEEFDAHPGMDDALAVVHTNDHSIYIEGDIDNAIFADKLENNHWAHIRPGRWEAEIEGNKVCFFLNNSKPSQRMVWMTTECFAKSELSNIPTNEGSSFSIEREAGATEFNGHFKNNFGSGTFKFVESPSFRNYLKKENMDVRKDADMFHLFLNNVNRDYIDFLKSSGFKVRGKDLVELSVHGINRQRAQDFLDLFKDLNHKNYKLTDLVEFEIHDVDPEYVREMRAMGLDDLNARQVVEARIHDVDPEFIKSIRTYGFKDMDLRQIIEFSIHDIDADYIESLKNLGFRELSHQDIIHAGIHDIDPEYIQEIHNAGFSDMSMDQLVEFAIHDIDADFIKAIKDSGIEDISRQDIIHAGIHDVDIGLIKSMKQQGFDLNMNEIVQLAIHDVDEDYIADMRAIGLDNLSFGELIQGSIHDVSPDYVQNLKDAGYSNLDMGTLIQFSIHDVSPRFIREMRELGYENLSTSELIQANIHDISPRYVRQMHKLGFKDASISKLIQSSIHDVYPSFIERAREKGHNYDDLSDYIQLKIRGL